MAVKETQENIKSTRLSLESFDGEIERCEATQRASMDAVTLSVRNIEEQQRKFLDASNDVKVAEKESKPALAQEAAHLKEITKQEKQKAKVLHIRDAGLNTILAGKHELPFVKKFLKDLLALGCEPSLVASATPVLMRPESERTSFDNIVISNMEQIIKARIDSAEEVIKGLKEVAQEAINRADERRSTIAHLRELQDKQCEEVEKARKSKKEAEYEHRKAMELVTELTSEHERKKALICVQESQLRGIEDAIAMLTSVAARSSKVPKPQVLQSDVQDGHVTQSDSADATPQASPA